MVVGDAPAAVCEYASVRPSGDHAIEPRRAGGSTLAIERSSPPSTDATKSVLGPPALETRVNAMRASSGDKAIDVPTIPDKADTVSTTRCGSPPSVSKR